MKLNQHYVFNVTEDKTGPYVVAYSRDKVGIWRMDIPNKIEFRIEMTMEQGEEVARNLAQIIAAQKEKVILDGLEDTNEDNI